MGLVPKQVKLVNQVMELVNQLLRVCGGCALSVHGNLNIKKMPHQGDFILTGYWLKLGL